MPSPFPGMEPYLEQPAFWSSFHSRLIVAIADEIEKNLSSEYYVEVETRTYLSNNGDALLIGIPDMVVASSSTEDSLPNESASESTIAVQSRPQRVQVPMPEEVQERYLEIRDVATGEAIAAIELLSPKNKQAGKGRIAYEEKRAAILGSLTHLVELDLLRGGKPMPLVGTVVTTPYQILISRSHQRPMADLYGFTLREALQTLSTAPEAD